MPMVEGIGDEVLQVFGICIVILIFVTAWKSTAIRELPQIRAVFIFDRRTQTAFPNDVPSPTAPSAPPDPGQGNGSNVTNNEISASQTEASDAVSGDQNCKQQPASQNQVNALRLSYFSNLQNQAPSTSASSAGDGQDSDATRPMQNDTRTDEAMDGVESEHSIRVKLKYLNDDQRIVRGDLKELLGQFKRRYFETELSNNKNVLLIFQGRVLREDETLETIGMYDNCVVHCLVKSGRSSNAESRQAASPSSNTPTDWNLGPVFVATLMAMFILAWFSYWTYPQLFGITSSILLACLSTIFISTLASLYYPHLFQSLLN